MPEYGYRCRDCGAERVSLSREDIQSCSCGGVSKRDYSTIQLGSSSFKPHFNHAVGAFVSNSRQFDDLLKLRSEQNSLRTGTDHNYTRIDPGESPRPTADDHIFEVQEKAWRDKKAPSDKVTLNAL